uniref:Uncharacterized protein n=1 Tax=Rhizophora mucronata TaxID=61149 RepID=A0A2P2P8X2_RHIMU
MAGKKLSDSELFGPALKTNVTVASILVNQEAGEKGDFSGYFGIFKNLSDTVHVLCEEPINDGITIKFKQSKNGIFSRLPS